MKNTPVLFDEMTRHLQLLFNPTDAGRIINKFTWSRTWNALVIYLLPPKAKFCEKLFLAHGKDKTLIWRWISANWDSTLEVQYRFCQQPKGVSTKPHIHSPCSPPPPSPTTSFSPSDPSPTDCHYGVACSYVRKRRQGIQFCKHFQFCVGSLARANQSIKLLQWLFFCL